MNPTDKNTQPKKKRPVWARVLIWLGIIIASIIILAAILLFVASRWLTPERLTDIIDREASEQLHADVRSHNVRYSLSGSFPMLRIELDSICIRSRDFDNLPDSLRRKLPRNADMLLSVGHISGAINIAKISSGQISLGDLSVKSLRLNLVQATDSINNFSFKSLPHIGKDKIPHFNLEGVHVTGNSSISYTSIPQQTAVNVRLAKVELLPAKGANSYSFSVPGRITVESEAIPPLGVIPFDLAGNVQFAFNPFDVSTDIRSFKLNAMGTALNINAQADNLTSNPKVKAAVSADTDIANAGEFASMLKQYALTGNMHLDANVSFKLNGTEVKDATLDVKADSPSLSLHFDNLDLALKGLKFGLSAAKLKKPVDAARFVPPAEWSRDSASLDALKHTSELLAVNLPDNLKQLMREWNVTANVRLKRADLTSPRYRADNRLRDLNITATLDSVVLHRIDVSSGDTRGVLSARIGNLRQFLTSTTPAPLRIALNADFDTLQLNNLARVYALSNPESALAQGDSKRITDHLESKAYILPRNIEADIHATAKRIRYINLKFYDLKTGISVANGIADIDSLQLASDFCHADAHICYDTSDMQHLSAEASLNVDDINVVKLLQNFESIERKFPAINNLSGMLGVHASTHLLIFPNMYLNVPSLWADANVDAWDLDVKQNKFIHHIAKMLMLYSKDDLKIADMHIHAGVHSNILEVFPFTFEMSKYKLQFEGLNNFNGDLYYHIGVENWPLRLPFGVNIKGTFDHPQLRFGGRHWHDSNSVAVTSDIESHNRIDLLCETVKYGTAFVHTAATYRE